MDDKPPGIVMTDKESESEMGSRKAKGGQHSGPTRWEKIRNCEEDERSEKPNQRMMWRSGAC